MNFFSIILFSENLRAMNVMSRNVSSFSAFKIGRLRNWTRRSRRRTSASCCLWSCSTSALPPSPSSASEPSRRLSCPLRIPLFSLQRQCSPATSWSRSSCRLPPRSSSSGRCAFLFSLLLPSPAFWPSQSSRFTASGSSVRIWFTSFCSRSCAVWCTWPNPTRMARCADTFWVCFAELLLGSHCWAFRLCSDIQDSWKAKNSTNAFLSRPSRCWSVSPQWLVSLSWRTRCSQKAFWRQSLTSSVASSTFRDRMRWTWIASLLEQPSWYPSTPRQWPQRRVGLSAPPPPCPERQGPPTLLRPTPMERWILPLPIRGMTCRGWPTRAHRIVPPESRWSTAPRDYAELHVRTIRFVFVGPCVLSSVGPVAAPAEEEVKNYLLISTLNPRTFLVDIEFCQ